ncbi:hypothetical protein KUA19_35455, partial [Catellatospora sp. NEAU-YM18]|nr:hypothetical protein [Catellatospora tritici]
MRSAHTGNGLRRRAVVIAGSLLAASLVLTTAACGGSDDPAKPGGKVKLTIATFGEFGYKDLYKEYQQLNPNVEITERITKAEDHHKNLAAHLA